MNPKSFMCMAVAAISLVACEPKVDPLIVAADDYCDINAPRGEVNKQGEILAWGWAFDKSNTTIPKDIVLQFMSDDKVSGLRIPLTRDARPDLAKAFKLPIEMGGFKTKIDLKSLPAGSYTVSVVQSTRGKILLCTGVAKVVLR